MKLKNILTFLFSLFIFTGCSTVEKSEFIEERNKKLELLSLLENFSDSRIKDVGIIFRSICIKVSSEKVFKDLDKRYKDLINQNMINLGLLVYEK